MLPGQCNGILHSEIPERKFPFKRVWKVASKMFPNAPYLLMFMMFMPLCSSLPLSVGGTSDELLTKRRDEIWLPRLSLKRLWFLPWALSLIFLLILREASCHVVNCPEKRSRWQGNGVSGEHSARPYGQSITTWVHVKADSPQASLQMRPQPEPAAYLQPHGDLEPEKPILVTTNPCTTETVTANVLSHWVWE